jgi:hypothetical protein
MPRDARRSWPRPGKHHDQARIRSMSIETALDLYLDEVRRVRSTRAGTAETSYYPALALTLNSIGSKLKPRVYCLHHPSGGSGIPDFGLFVQQQFSRGNAPEWTTAVSPERGVLEVKGASHRISTLVASRQIADKYLPVYGLVLATNLWQFRLIEADGTVVESFDLASNEAGFWRLAEGTRPEPLKIRFADFLQRCLLTRAPLTRPADLAFFLASYARDALARLAERPDLLGLKTLQNGMQEALGISFDGKDGERLFRSTLVQTLFYGLFSAWVVHTRTGRGHFDWRSAQWSLTVPVARFLFQQVATPEALEPLDLVPLMDAAGAALERVQQPAFFAAFNDDTQAVQYFYEPFLEFFDPTLRQELGVWYTPPEIVSYMVERTDRLLRTELGVADGLADPNVWVLDPCCGTGSYLVAVLERIRRTLQDRGLGDLVGERLREAAMRRIVGFEIMTAPFVIAHWQVGETLRRAGAPFAERQRASVFLTNALVGWETSSERNELPGFETLIAERTAAAAVKQEEPILVVIGNPPYNAYAGVSPAQERGLVEPYKVGLQQEWGVRKFNLDDLFVRFFRIAERRIAERTGRGVVSYISNWSWQFLPSFVVMRDRLLHSFDSLWIDCLNGDSRETGKQTPEGLPDPSVFSSTFNRAGIRVGTAVSTFVRRDASTRAIATVHFRQYWGVNKRKELLESLEDPAFDDRYQQLAPAPDNEYLLRLGAATSSYKKWPQLSELANVGPLPGLLEKRGGSLISLDRQRLETQMRAYLDPVQSYESAAQAAPKLATKWARYKPQETRNRLMQAEGYLAANIQRYTFFAFDRRWAYVTPIRPLWNDPRPQLLHILPDAAGFLVVRPQRIAQPEGYPAYWTSCLGDDYVLHKHAFYIPIVENLSGAPRPNLSPAAAQYLSTLGLTPDVQGARLIWHHALAVLYSPAYIAENDGGLRKGWPRTPLPGDVDILRASAELGARLAALLDPDAPVEGVTTGRPLPELRLVAVPTTKAGSARDWRITAGWGTRTAKGITMPGRGRTIDRPYHTSEMPVGSGAAQLGSTTHDVFLNEDTCWQNVPDAVWEFRVGGYQVLKKWLSYRDYSIAERELTAEDVGHFQQSARRIAAILLLGPNLDASYRACVSAHRALAAADG